MRKKLLVILLFTSTLGQAQNFVQKSDFPGGNRYKMVTISQGSKIYCGLGIDNTSTMHNDFYEYETTTDVWTQKNNFPFAPRRNSTACFINGNLYAGFGYNGSASLNDWWMYDSISDSWNQKANLPADPRYWTSMFEWNGNGYLVGGEKYNGSYTNYNDMWQYNPANDTWTQLPDFIGNPRCGTFCQPSGNFVYYGLGEAANISFFSDIYKYDCNTQTWTSVAPIPPTPNVPVADGGAWWSTTYNNKIILMSIQITPLVPDDYKSIYVYDIATDSWTIYPLANILGTRVRGIGGQNGSKAYFGSGLDNFNVVYQDLWEIDLATLLTGIDEQNPGLANIKVYAANHKIYTTIPREVFDTQNLSLEVYTVDGKLISANCLEYSQSLDVCNLTRGNYVYLIKSDKRNLKSGKLFLD